jgi:hypothetical protein
LTKTLAQDGCQTGDVVLPNQDAGRSGSHHGVPIAQALPNMLQAAVARDLREGDQPGDTHLGGVVTQKLHGGREDVFRGAEDLAKKGGGVAPKLRASGTSHAPP